MSAVGTLARHALRALPLNVLTFPLRPSYAHALGKVPHKFYAVRAGTDWEGEGPPPPNFRLLAPGQIPDDLDFDVLLCPRGLVPQGRQLAKIYQLPTVLFDDAPCPFGEVRRKAERGQGGVAADGPTASSWGWPPDSIISPGDADFSRRWDALLRAAAGRG